MTELSLDLKNFLDAVHKELTKKDHLQVSGQDDHMKEYNKSMAKVQGGLKGAFKDQKNPFHNSKYANLESVIGVSKELLAENGFSFSQTPCPTGDHLITTVRHVSGAFTTGSFPLNTMKDKKGQLTPQTYLSSITYARRGALASVIGIHQTDDDGNEASKVSEAEKNDETNNKKDLSPITAPERKSDAERITDMARDVMDEGKPKLSDSKVKTLKSRMNKLTKTKQKEFEKNLGITQIAQLRQDEYVRANQVMSKLEG